MKKIIALFLVLTLVCSLAACGEKKDPAASGSGQSAMEALKDDATPAQIVIADFLDKANSGSYKTAEELGTALSEAEYLGFAGASMPVEEGYLNGFTDEVKGFQEGQMFGPMIGSIPFIGYVFVLEDGAKAEDFAENLKSLADLRWNICTAADEMEAGVAGNMVCFVMSPASLEE